jgi:hypothetical protein
LNAQGIRVIGLVYKPLPMCGECVYSEAVERDVILKGFLAFLGPPKSTAAEAHGKPDGNGHRRCGKLMGSRFMKLGKRDPNRNCHLKIAGQPGMDSLE